MEDETHTTSQPPVPSTSAASAPPAAADEAHSQHLVRRAQIREEAERDAAEQVRRRLESHASKAAAREAGRVAALAAQAAQWRSLSPAQRLFTDGVALCLGFLSLADFNSAAQTCKGWRSGAHAVKSLSQSELTASLSVLPALFCSPFRRLVASFADSDMAAEFDERRVSCRPVLLKGLHTLSNLTSLSLRLSLSKFDGAAMIQYPPRLSTARFQLGSTCNWSDRDMFEHHAPDSSVLHGLTACASLTRLQLELTYSVPIALTALGALKQLRHLSIDGYAGPHYTPAVLRAIQHLPQLETLSLNHAHDDDEEFFDTARPFTLEWLAPLFTAPHQLQGLQVFNSNALYLWDNDLCLHLLPSLTSLTELKSPCVSLLVLPALAAFPKLRTLHLTFDGQADFDFHEDNGDELDAAYDDDGRARLSVLVPHLAHCSLTELSLYEVACDAQSIAALCASHPLLTALDLHFVSLTTVHPLSALPQLRKLTLGVAAHSGPQSTLFDQLCACKSLQRLDLAKMSPPLSEAQQQQLQPPSTLLPLLTSFNYSSHV